jgi:hypothetical protein
MVTNHFIYLNSGLMIKDLLLKHEGEAKWRFETFMFAP